MRDCLFKQRNRCISDVFYTMTIDVDFGSIGVGVGGVGALQTTETDLMSSALDLFSKPIAESAMLYARETKIRPTSMESTGPFIFDIPAQSGLLLDPSTLRLDGVVRIEEKDATTGWGKLAADSYCSVVNLFPFALFRTIEVDINGALVSFISSPANHYKSYIETMLSYGRDAAATHLHCARLQFSHPTAETQGAAMVVPTYDKSTSGRDLRTQWFAKGEKVDFSIPLHSDVLKVDRYFPDNMTMTVKLARSDDSFVLIAPDTSVGKYRIIFDELALYIRRVAPSDSYLSSMNSKLIRGERALYPLQRTIVRYRQIPIGESSFLADNLFSSKLPVTVIMGMVLSEAFNGKLSLDPFKFETFDLKYAVLKVNSQLVPAEPYRPNLKNATTKRFMREYRSLMDNTGIHHGNSGNLVTPERFTSDCFFLAFDLTPDLCNNFHLHAPKAGTIEIDLSFGTPLAKGVTLLTHATYNDVMEIDVDRISYLTTSVNG